MEKVLELANNPMMWFLAFISIFIVLTQAVIYFRMAKKYANDTGVLTNYEIKKSLKVGAIATIGPAVAVFAIAVVLIGLIGGPLTLARVGVVGSAAYESIAASVGSGGTVGTENFTFTLLATVTWVMAIGVSGWLINVIFITKTLDTTQEKIKRKNPKRIALMGTITPFMVFLIMGYSESVKKIMAKAPSYGVLIAMIAGGVSMFVLNYIASTSDKLNWLREWGMGFAVIISIIIGAFIDNGGF